MKVLVFLLALIFVVVCGAWLFTSEHSPLVSALGIGAEGDFESEARAQVPSLVDMREDACSALKRQRDRHEWEGRFQHVSVKLLKGDSTYDAEGTVSYYAINPRDGSSQDCQDVFRRARSDSKWQLVSDPGGDERKRLQDDRNIQANAQPDAAPEQNAELGQYKTALQAFLQSLQPFEAELRNIENAKQVGCSLVEYSQHVQALIAAYGQIAPATVDFPKFILRNDGLLLTTDYASQAREFAKTIVQGEGLNVQSWSSLIDQKVKGDISEEECSERVSTLLSETNNTPLFNADDAARLLLNSPDLDRWVVGSAKQRTAQEKLEADVVALRANPSWQASADRRTAYSTWSDYVTAVKQLEQISDTVSSIQNSIDSAQSLSDLAQLKSQLEATDPQQKQASQARNQAARSLESQPRAAVIAAGEDLLQDSSTNDAQREVIENVLVGLRL